MAAFVVFQICFLFMFVLGGVTCRFAVQDCDKKYNVIDFVLEENNCKFRGDGLYTYEGVKERKIKKITFDRLTEKSFLFVDGVVDVVQIFGGGINCQSVRCTYKDTDIWINTLKCNSEESPTISTGKQPTVSPTSTSSVTTTTSRPSTPNVKSRTTTTRPLTPNVKSRTTTGTDLNMCPTTPPMESTTVEAESSSIGWVVGFVVSCIGVGLIFQFYRGLRQMYDDMQIPTPVINGPPAPLLPVIIGPPAPLPPVINGPQAPLPPILNGPPAPLPPVINGPPAPLPPVINGAPAPRPQAQLRRSNRLKNKPVYYHNM
ncbi:unnamed protein product [Mytilus edulis]|uniref:Uncharacterized protein n=1 Tax=Mytilus edulis TaxID=6550 RepID=A0A8S3PVL8_MYTED|nr:unnamed protein product [Mytilus edulis]